MAPQDVMLPEGTEAKFTCTATTDPEEIQNLRLYWMKDGTEIDYAVRIGEAADQGRGSGPEDQLQGWHGGSREGFWELRAKGEGHRG